MQWFFLQEIDFEGWLGFWTEINGSGQLGKSLICWRREVSLFRMQRKFLLKKSLSTKTKLREFLFLLRGILSLMNMSKIRSSNVSKLSHRREKTLEIQVKLSLWEKWIFLGEKIKMKYSNEETIECIKKRVLRENWDKIEKTSISMPTSILNTKLFTFKPPEKFTFNTTKKFHIRKILINFPNKILFLM